MREVALKVGDPVKVMVSGPYARAGVVATYQSISSDGWIWAKRTDGFSFCAPAEHFEPYPASFPTGEERRIAVLEAAARAWLATIDRDYLDLHPYTENDVLKALGVIKS